MKTNEQPTFEVKSEMIGTLAAIAVFGIALAVSILYFCNF